MGFVVVCLCAAVALPAPTLAMTGSAPLARTTSGEVAGTATGDVLRFRGIPYATPPAGRLRWHSPQPAPQWTGIRQATSSGPACAQGDPAKPGTLLAGSNEDCLYLDVTSPRIARNLPVMMWIYGGGNTSGNGADYDPARLAARGDMVVVTINYRLGVFGFYGDTGLPGSGTFALQDQQQALRWVRANASAFGGNPDAVTVFGESAGAVDICALLTSPDSAGLFQRAIMESGSCLTRVPSYAAGLAGTVHVSTSDFWNPVSADDAAGATLATALGCRAADPTGCLRSANPAAVLSAQNSTAVNFGPAYGTPVLPQSPAAALKRGQFTRVPILSGSNHDEARLTTMIIELLAGAFTPQSYHAVLSATFGPAEADAIEHEYPVPSDGDAGMAFATMDTDRVFVCPQLATNRQLADRTRTSGYEFADPTAPTFSPYYSSRPAGAAHASELAYLFDLRNGGPYQGLDHTELAPPQRQLGNTMIDMWAGFARGGHRTWPTYPTVLSLAPSHIGPVDAWAEHHCGFWATTQANV
jgi:para-nitrobenzyl esterase